MNTESEQERQTAANAYIECAFWADAPCDEEGNELECDLLPEGEQRMISDLFDFLDDPAVARDVVGIDAGQVGHDFWLTRNGHGAGFWDRGLGEIGDRLTKAAEVYGSDYPEEYVTMR